MTSSESSLVTMKTELTHDVYLYGQKIPFKPYEAKPLYSMKYHVQGHTKKNCQQINPSCFKGGKDNHASTSCTAPKPYCKNCKTLGHSVFQNDQCPTHHQLADILRISTEQNISFSIVAAKTPKYCPFHNNNWGKPSTSKLILMQSLLMQTPSGVRTIPHLSQK